MNRKDRRANAAALRRAAKKPGRKSDIPTEFKIALGRQGLEVCGPLIPGRWCVPSALEAALLAQGLPVPPPVHGAFLIDTGATSTCIGLATANAMGLQPIGSGKSYGAGGMHTHNLFAATFHLQIIDEITKKTLDLKLERAVAGIPDLESFLKDSDLRLNGSPARVIGLLGRDFLRCARFVYDGPSGDIRVSIDLSATDTPPKP